MPLVFNTIAVSDNQTQGTPGMRASLVSREVIADSIELMAHAHDFDALVCLVGCDKTVPRRSWRSRGSTGRPSCSPAGRCSRAAGTAARLTIQDVWEAVGAHGRGRMSRADLDEIERAACPGAGYCAGNFTANTMAIAVDMLGLGFVGDGLIPAAYEEEKDAAAARAGALAVSLAERGRRAALPRPPRAGERDGGHRRQRRLDERLPAPAGDRARGGRAADAGRPRRDRRADAGARRPAAGRALRAAEDLHRAGGTRR